MSDIKVQEVEYCKINVYYVADADEIERKQDQVLQAFKDAPVPGFRKGKQTINAIKMHYRDQIKEAMKRALTESAFHNTLFEKGYRPYGEPYIGSMFFERGEFNCDFIIHIKPDFEIASYKGLNIPKPHSAMTITDISAEIMQQLRIKFGETIPYEDNDFVQVGDNIIIDFDGSINGQNVPALSKQGAVMEVGTSKLPGFDDMLLGMKQEEERKFSLLVPEGSLPSLVGQTIDFTVKLSAGTKSIPHALNDELAIKMGKESFIELQTDVDGAAANKYSMVCRQAIIDMVQKKLIIDNQFKVPAFMTEAEGRMLIEKANLKWDEVAQVDKDKYLELAEDNVKLALILDRIAENDPEAQLTDNETFSIIKDHLAKKYGESNVDNILKEMVKNGSLQMMAAQVKNQFVLDFICKNVNIIE
jgi:trigger factor